MDRLRRLGSRDFVSGIALAFFSILYFLAARALPPGAEGGAPGPAFFPKLLAAAAFLLGVAIAARSRVEAAPVPASTVRPLLLMAGMATYVFAFSLLSFGLSTLVLTGLTVALAGGRAPRTLVIVPLITTLVLYGIFELGLGVPLELGR